MKLFVKLSGETIVGHQWDNQDDFDGATYNAEVSNIKLTNEDKDYKYKVVTGSLVELSQAEIDAHPNKIKKDLLDQITEMKHKEKEKEAWKLVKKLTLTVEQEALVDELIAELSA